MAPDVIPYAHSVQGRPESEWQLLEEHLRNTAELAERFSSSFAPGWGTIAGLWHDAGKYRLAFQQYIRGGARAGHKMVGALVAKSRGAANVAFAVAGHHGGMPDFEDLRTGLLDSAALLADARTGGLPEWIDKGELPACPNWAAKDKAAFSLWTRFLFSALVDADFLDTERFYAGGAERDLGSRPLLIELKARLDDYLSQKTKTAARTPVNEMRARVLDACRNAARRPQGSFTLTVPTGGGKTLSSLAFALDHAVHHSLERVIVVIPYTSIIEQTAEEYRRALGDSAVLEHHTNVDPDRESHANRLASENWNAPVVVTTSVQFFESLYANKPSKCRKLHRMAQSVVIFDEVQTFPADLLTPVRSVLANLAANYRTTILLCTATQPALLPDASEIVPEPQREFKVVSDRCEILMPRTNASTDWESLAEQLRHRRQAMAIVHRRDDAQQLAELVGNECLHLSARMCARHRSVVLAEAKDRLATGAPCLLVATQLVEAGVDIDFPEVFRAFAGLDSLAQAAGRCNREGRSTGTLHVFFASTQPPIGVLRTAEGVARVMARRLCGSQIAIHFPRVLSAAL